MKLKQLFIAVATAGFLLSLAAENKADNLEIRGRRLSEQAETLRNVDPDFTAWVQQQDSIYRAYSKAYRYDLKNDPWEAPYILEDWENLLSRMEKEFSWAQKQPDLEKMGVVNVKDFGAKADGVTDDAPAVQKAINFAAKNQKGVVFMPKGKYFMKHGKGFRVPALYFRGISNLKLKGEPGTVIVMDTTKVPMFTVHKSSNIRFEDLHITATKPIFSTGLITGYTPDNKGLIVTIDGGLKPDDEAFSKCEMSNFRIFDAGLAEDGKTPIIYENARHTRQRSPFNFVRLKHLKDNQYSLYPPVSKGKKASDEYSTGTRLVNFTRDHMGAFFLIDSDRCRLNRVSVDRIGGLVIKASQCDALFVTGCSVAAAANEKFNFATAADFYFSCAASLGGFYSRNIVRNTADDLYNIHGTNAPILRQEGKILYVADKYHEFSFLRKNMPYIKKIDILNFNELPTEFYYSRGNTPVLRRSTRFKVVSAQLVTLNHPKNNSKVNAIRLELDRDPGKLITLDPYISWQEMIKFQLKEKRHWVHFPDFCAQGQVISNNYFADAMGRAWYMGNGSVLRDNTFSMRYGWPVYCTWNKLDGTWRNESCFARVVTYENNCIRTSENTMLMLNHTRYYPDDSSSWTRHLYVRNNTFIIDMPSIFYKFKGPYHHEPLIDARGLADFELVGNTFFMPQVKGGLRMVLKDIKGRISDNKFIGPWSEDKIIRNVTLEKKSH